MTYGEITKKNPVLDFVWLTVASHIATVLQAWLHGIQLKIAPFPKEERCAVMKLDSIAPWANFNEEKQMLLVAYRATAEGPLLPSSASAVSGCE